MSADAVRIEQLEVTLPAAGRDDGQRFGEVLARALERQVPGAPGGYIGRLDINVPHSSDPAAVARAIADAIRRTAR